jgi:phage major head subunit gpT-like protein
MIINNASLQALRVGFNAAMQRGIAQVAAPMHDRISTRVPSSVMEEDYGWLGELPEAREWIGERHVQNLSEAAYSIKEKPWELTVGVSRDHVETDKLGQYALRFEAIGRSTVSKPARLVWDLLKAGFATNCYDGQYFFDTDHPVLDANGVAQSVANTDGGSGTPWFLLDVNQVIKPIILQVRRDFGQLVSKDRPDDDNVFLRNEYVYGVDARMNVGYSFWQFAWGSKQTLNATTYATARAAMQSFKGDYGRPLGISPNLLVVPPALESAGRKLLNSELASGGETNEWKDTAELLVVPWLA